MTAHLEYLFTEEACDGRLFDALLYATLNPDDFNQESWGTTDALAHDWQTARDWPCGTSACLFGTAVIRAGLAEPGLSYTVTTVPPRYWIQINETGIALLGTLTDDTDVAWDVGQEFTTLGAMLFGLSYFQAQALSCPSNSLAEMWTMALQFTDARVRLPLALVRIVREIDDIRANRQPA